MEFNYYYGTEADQFSFIRIPKVLLKNETFRSLSIQAKVLYGLLLDRMSLSVKNHWLDDNNRVFIIYQIVDIQDDLGYSKKKSIEYLGELEAIGLVEKRKRGLGLPNILYVKNFLSSGINSRDVEKYTSVKSEISKEIEIAKDKHIQESAEKSENEAKTEMQGIRSSHVYTSRSVEKFTSRGVENDTSGGDRVCTSEVPDLAPLKSNIKYINTDMSNTESNLISSQSGLDEIDEYHYYENLVRRNLEADVMLSRYPFEQERISSIISLIVETLISKNDSIVVSSDRIPVQVVKSRMMSLNSMHLEYVLDCLASNTTKIRNIKKYLLTTLYNAPVTMDSYYQAEVNHDMPQFTRRKVEQI